MMQDASLAPSLFCCYAHEAHEDVLLCEELDTHLATLRQLGLIQVVSSRNISAGTEWQEAMDHYLSTADIVLLLLSADFLASDYYYNMAMRALQRHQADEAVVIPIILRSADWEQTPLGMLQALPRDSRPVVQWPHRDEAWKQITTEIRKVVGTLQQSVVLVSSLPQQDIALHLISLLEAYRIPFRHIEPTPETTWLQEAIRQSSAIVLVTSPETRSTYLLKEVRNFAILYQRPVFAIWVVGPDQSEEQTPFPEAWSKSISIDLESENQNDAFQELLRHLKLLRHSSAFPASVPEQNVLVPLPEPRNPYKGLRAFTSDDTRDFFGRTALINQFAHSVETMLILEKQEKQHDRLLAVVGPSGSGKSSVVMAGLLPCLRAGEVFDSET